MGPLGPPLVVVVGLFPKCWKFEKFAPFPFVFGLLRGGMPMAALCLGLGMPMGAPLPFCREALMLLARLLVVVLKLEGVVVVVVVLLPLVLLLPLMPLLMMLLLGLLLGLLLLLLLLDGAGRMARSVRSCPGIGTAVRALIAP